MKGKRSFTLAMILLVCAVLGAGCGQREKPKQYPFTGTIVNIDPQGHAASIHNEDIPGWMTAMTMDYPMENAEEWKGLKPGDKISATVNVTSDKFWLSGVKKVAGP